MTSDRNESTALLERVVGIENGVSKLGRALWLYVILIIRAGDRGRVIRTTPHLAKDIGVSEDTLVTWLNRLRDAGLVEVQSPPPYLVTKLRFWPGRSSSRADMGPASSSKSALRQGYVPVSSSKAAAAAKREDGGVGEGETLLDQTIETLGSADREEIRALIENYPSELTRRALARVQNTPDAQIRKSREALFRYLLDRLSK